MSNVIKPIILDETGVRIAQAIESIASGGGGGGGMSNAAKQALLNCVAHVAWADDNGQDYYDALEAALNASSKEVDSISAAYTQSGLVFDTDSLDSLKSGLVVTATYTDTTTETIDGSKYTLSGTLSIGTSTITVTYEGKTDTFTVSVVGLPTGYTRYDFVKNNEGFNTDDVKNAIDTGISSSYCDPEYEHEITFMVESNPVSTNNYSIYGCRPTTGSAGTAQGNCVWFDQGIYPDKIAVGYNGEDAGYVIDWAIGTKHTLKLSGGNVYVDGVIVKAMSGQRTSYSNTDIYLFAVGMPGYPIQGSVKSYVRIYDFSVKEISTGTMISKLIPCTNADSKAGFYDVIRSTFYAATNYSKFTAANEA